MHSRFYFVALAGLTTLAVPTIARAQKPGPLLPSQVLAQREALDLSAHQLRELSLLSTQVRRYQRALLIAPSKPWIAGSKGMTHDEASERVLALLSPHQRDLALRTTKGDSMDLAGASRPAVLLD